MRICAIALWNADGDVRRIDLNDGLNIITGASQTGKSALIEIIRYCLGATELRVPAGPIADTVDYYGLLVKVGPTTSAFFGRPALAAGVQSTTEAQLEIGLDELPDAEMLKPNTTVDALRDWIGRAIGIEENRFDPPDGASRPPLVAKLSHALIHCFQRQDEIASRQILFHGQADSFVAQAIRDTMPYFLGVTGPEQLRQASILRALRRDLADDERDRRGVEETLVAGLSEATALLSQAADAGLTEVSHQPTTLAEALEALTRVRDTPPPQSPRQPPGEEFERLQTQRRQLTTRLRDLREQRALASAIAQGGEAAEHEGVEQVVRLQPIGALSQAADPVECPVCEQPLREPPPAVDQLLTSLRELENQITAVQADRPALVAVQDEILSHESSVRTEFEANTEALERLAASADAVDVYQQRLNLGAWVRGRIDHYLEKALVATDERLQVFTQSEQRLRERITALEQDLDPGRVRDAATSVLIGVGRRMTEMAQSLGLEHAESGVRVDLARLTVVADTPSGPVYMNTNIGSAKNWVGYHLATALGLQEHFVRQRRPVPRFLILDQPTQAFFTPDRSSAEISDEDRADALSQFRLMRDVAEGLDGQLQVLVLDHADFEEDWFQDAVVEHWRGGQALIPTAWLSASPTDDDASESAPDEVPSTEDSVDGTAEAEGTPES